MRKFIKPFTFVPLGLILALSVAPFVVAAIEGSPGPTQIELLKAD